MAYICQQFSRALARSKAIRGRAIHTLYIQLPEVEVNEAIVPINAIIADGHEVVRHGLRMLLAGKTDIQLVHVGLSHHLVYYGHGR